MIDGKGDFFGIAEKCGKSVVSYQLSVVSYQLSDIGGLGELGGLGMAVGRVGKMGRVSMSEVVVRAATGVAA